MRRVSLPIAVVIVLAAMHSVPPFTRLESQARTQSVAPRTFGALRTWDDTVARMLRNKELVVRLERADTLIPGRSVEQLDQYHEGVRIWGGSLSRQLDRDGIAISVFGTLYSDFTLDVVPVVDQQDAKRAIERIGGTELGPDRQPELVILPTDDSSMKLAWVDQIVSATDHIRLFIDAKTGAELRRESLVERQVQNAFVGHGRGVLGDDKKVSTLAFGGTFISFDTLRPPDISTFDLRANLTRVIQYLNGVIPLSASDYAVGANNEWTDGAVVDAHVYSSYTYDYYYKRFGRQGLDNANHRVINVVHPVARANILSAPLDIVFQFYANAFYLGGTTGVMVYGEGFPPGLSLGGQHWDFVSGALDAVSHELTHGVTAFSSNLTYLNESGALNEAFSDIMGTSVEFFFQPAGTGKMQADYLIGEDVVTAALPGALNGIRSMENPALYGQPDHYSRRFTGTADNGGVHINSGIANHAFYLAIEGGTNRTSGIRVQGVGGANRLQIERIFYRAFVQLMPSSANFAMARIITLQAAQDLYGVNSAPYNAVRDAWTAVGVN